MTVVDTAHGAVRGAESGGVHAFKGIPYAAEPSGPLRFAAPAPPAAWDGVRDALSFGAAAPQGPPAPGLPAAWQPLDGLDCLTVNVWTPSPGAAGLPVLVWIHGGRWRIGSAAMPQYDGAVLASAGVVVVTLNYRLGFEGFGRLPGVPENRGLLDQVAALEWVRDNVAGFGGDPSQVTVFGQSAGAASAVLLMGTGLYRRAIAQSVPTGFLAPEVATFTAEELALVAGVPPTASGFAELPPVVSTPTDVGPVVDGSLVPSSPWAAVRAEVDLVCGFTHEESRAFGTFEGMTMFDAVSAVGLPVSAVDAYLDFDDPVHEAMSDGLIRMPTTRVAAAHAAAGGRTWLYDFAWRGPLGAAHGVDVPFTFGVPASRFAARLIGSPPPAEFEALSSAVRASWTSFAASGDPGWPEYPVTRRWDVEPVDGEHPLGPNLRIWGIE